MRKSPDLKLTSGSVSFSAFLIGGLISLVAAAVASMALGAVTIPASSVAEALFTTGEAVRDSHYNIILRVRLPRTILAALVGASLSIAGASFQGLFRNPLAGPYVLGVSSGASFGAVLAMVLGLGSILGMGAVPLTAFGGALLTIFTVYNLARRNGEIDVTTMLLAGIAISSMFSALISLLLTFAREQVIGSAVFWMMGGLSGATWRRISFVAIPFIVGSALLWVLAQSLNAFLLGEEEAHNLGVNVSTLKKVILLTASFLTASAVAATGAIGFVGLIVPHAVRALVGPDHRRLFPGSAICGAAFLMLADTAARTLLAPIELQVGILTALLGGPFFLYVLRRHKTIGSP